MEDLDDITSLATSDGDLATAASLARRLLALYDEKAAAERRLREVSAAIEAVSQDDLPKALDACGWSTPSKGVIGGLPVRYGVKYQSGQLDDGPDKRERDGYGDDPRRPLEERLRALAWIEGVDRPPAEQHGDIIKNAITVLLPKGQEALAGRIVDFLASLGSNSMTVDRRRVVLWNTLTSFVKRLDEQGDDPPLDLLGVRKLRVATVLREKE